MPRRKLTRTQVKGQYKKICKAIYDLMTDKIGHPDSNVGMSLNKLLDLHKICTRLLKAMR